jgi:uncharacterized RDD family membrane protein YckC
VTQYWLTRDGERRGPYEEREILEGVRLGTVRPADLLSVEGMGKGVPIADVLVQLGGGAAGAKARRPLELAPLAPPDSSPYRPPSARVDDLAELALGNARYAGFWVRFAASVLDTLVLTLIYIVIALVLGLASYIFGFGAGLTAIQFALSVVPVWLYFALLESGPRCATYGKRAFHLRVLEAEGLTRIGFLRATVRWFARYLSMAPLMLGYLIQPFTPRKRALHDFIAGTVVVAQASHSRLLLALILVIFVAPLLVGFLLGAGLKLVEILGR